MIFSTAGGHGQLNRGGARLWQRRETGWMLRQCEKIRQIRVHLNGGDAKKLDDELMSIDLKH